MKLSKWATKQGIHYQTAWQWYKDGRIEGAYQTDTGSIFVQDADHVSIPVRTVVYARVSNRERKDSLKSQSERCASRHMQAWTNSDIQRKVERLMEERNVSVKLQSSTYKSQCCSSCGSVRKANRKGKVYTCKRCGFIGDADLNAACNHAQNLPPIPDAFFRTKKNLGHGFLWNSSGCFTLPEAEFAVPPSPEKAYA